MIVNFKLWYKDETGREEELEKDVLYIPDTILYNKYCWEKESAVYDFDNGKYTKVHYNQIV